MAERIPSLDIVWSVNNVGEQDLAGLQEAHYLKTNSVQDSEILRRVLNPADALRGTAWANREFLNLQRYLGPNSLSKEQVKELADILRVESPYAGEDLRATTFPVTLDRKGKKNRFGVLSMAGSEKVTEVRSFAESRIAGYIGLRAIPEGVLVPDGDLAARVWLGMATKPRQIAALNGLRMTLEQDRNLLPGLTKFNAMDVRTS
jgi:hypothetical protein